MQLNQEKTKRNDKKINSSKHNKDGKNGEIIHSRSGNLKKNVKKMKRKP